MAVKRKRNEIKKSKVEKKLRAERKGIMQLPDDVLSEILVDLPPEDYVAALCCCKRLRMIAKSKRTLEMLRSPIDYLAPSRIRNFHGGRGKCQKQAFITVDPTGRYYAVFWTSEHSRTEDWRGHVEIFDVVENKLVMDRHCRTPELSIESDYFGVSFLESVSFGYGKRPHVLLTTPYGKCTIHDLRDYGALRWTLSAATFHAYGEISSEIFAMPGCIAVATADSGEMKIRGDAGAKGPGALAIWELGSKPKCRVLDPGQKEQSSDDIAASNDGKLLVRQVNRKGDTNIQVWNTLLGQLLVEFPGEEFHLSRNYLVFVSLNTESLQGERLYWVSTSVLFSNPKICLRAHQSLPGIYLWHEQPVHTVFTHIEEEEAYIITIDEDAVMLKYSVILNGHVPRASSTIDWGLTCGERLFCNKNNELPSTRVYKCIIRGRAMPYLVSSVKGTPLGYWIVGAYARSVGSGGGKWHGLRYTYKVILNSMKSGACITSFKY